jgi:hypothetical protein
MDDWASGFRVDEAFHPWGTRFEAVAPGRVENGHASVELPCRSAYGFTMAYAELSAARPDRPVTSVAYELANAGASSKDLFAQLVIRLGQPAKVSRSEVTESANASDSVVLSADWRHEKIAIGLSLYGAPRPSDFGDGRGKLYVTWADRDAAAAPFLAEWTANSRAVADAAVGAKTKVFSVRYPIYEADVPPPEAHERALSTPELLQTPLAIAALLGPTTFALWSDAAGVRWHLSTSQSTIALGGPETSTLRLLEIAPAKGGGYTALEIGAWSVRDAYRSRDIAEAIHALERLSSLKIERHIGFDV